MPISPTLPKRIRIEAPDATAAFMLERRLAHRSPVTVGTRLSWIVELEAEEDEVGEIEAAVRAWLRDEDLAATVMTVDGAALTVDRDAALARSRD